VIWDNPPFPKKDIYTNLSRTQTNAGVLKVQGHVLPGEVSSRLLKIGDLSKHLNIPTSQGFQMGVSDVQGKIQEVSCLSPSFVVKTQYPRLSDL
jgi:hypothetical protein